MTVDIDSNVFSEIRARPTLAPRTEKIKRCFCVTTSLLIVHDGGVYRVGSFISALDCETSELFRGIVAVILFFLLENNIYVHTKTIGARRVVCLRNIYTRACVYDRAQTSDVRR